MHKHNLMTLVENGTALSTERIQSCEERQRTCKLTGSGESLHAEVSRGTQSENSSARLLRRIVKTQEDERKRIARDIHDHVGQQITSLKLKLQLLHNRCEQDAELIDQVKELQTIADQIDSEVDFLAWELRPSVIDDSGLAAAMKKFIQEWSIHFQIRAEFHHFGFEHQRLLPEIEINLYRICQEALNNICKHAQAKNVSVQLTRQEDSRIILIIEDDGTGFDQSEKAVVTANNRGMGLLGMKERTELVGGSFNLETAVGAGTTIYIRAPALFDKAKT